MAIIKTFYIDSTKISIADDYLPKTEQENNIRIEHMNTIIDSILKNHMEEKENTNERINQKVI